VILVENRDVFIPYLHSTLPLGGGGASEYCHKAWYEKKQTDVLSDGEKVSTKYSFHVETDADVILFLRPCEPQQLDPKVIRHCVSSCAGTHAVGWPPTFSAFRSRFRNFKQSIRSSIRLRAERCRKHNVAVEQVTDSRQVARDVADAVR